MTTAKAVRPEGRPFSGPAACFAAQVAATPHAVAVVAAGQRLTYAELDRRAGELAAGLARSGVGPDHVVGVLLDRSVTALAGLLAVWRAGAAYLPLDPALPAGRIGYMLETAGVRVVLTDPAGTDRLPESFSGQSVLAGETGGEPTGVIQAGPDDRDLLAYVLFTSGSTGRPKGVQISRRALMNLLFSVRARMDAGPGQVWLAATSFSFDISMAEVWLPLITGGTVVLATGGQVHDPVALCELVATEGVTHVQATPSGWRLLLAAGFGHRSVTAITTGEACPPSLAAELARRVPVLHNLYGPTETTVWSTGVRIPAGSDGAVAIGRPLPNTRAYLLDADLAPVAPGAVGELYLAGDGVARGYAGRPDLTAERFLPEPFTPGGKRGGSRRGSRMYRTGDLARIRPDGELECLGRVDHQVKVRGHRIELGEIEESLRRHPATGDAVVVAREDAQGDRTLVAYVTPAVAGTPPQGVQEHLARELPGYMVPAAVVVLARLPLLASGKVDRHALPAPDRTAYQIADQTADQDDGEHGEARTATERLIVRICAETLGLERIGVRDRFSRLGIDSLRIVTLLGAARRAGLAVQLKTLLMSGTIEELARNLDAAAVAPRSLAGVVLRDAAHTHQVPGASLVVLRNGEIDEVVTAGALTPGGAAVTESTRFHVASISKHVTTCLTLRLVDQGLLNLDQDVNIHLRRWRVPAGFRPVTIRHLLANRSGLSATPSTWYEPGAVMPSLVGLLNGTTPEQDGPIRRESAPESTFQKAGSHWAVLQLLLEDRTGTPFAQLADEQLFGPLGLGGSTFRHDFDDRAPGQERALGHDAQGLPVPGGRRTRPTVAANGLWSTALDLARIAVDLRHAYRGEPATLLSPGAARQMLTLQHPGSFYGLGTVLDDTGGDVEFGHAGEVVGFRAISMTRVTAGTGFVALTNSDGGKSVLSAVADLISGRTTP
ncbi:amino acid adenylation domain-containing protein [Kineosporia sp. J2-2]|uniref:Amino acid adenylation domain-containing protein n=1 Tax=Kineosporia corallincola TaxID=2835133 RepID=A0ABS5TG66_9ACTN|nr:amino acid adenylation domain-containing protein [Kineosporia corallincola]MBT0770088.1 amino acid adenylation domain-containing protein [Kineosporia corallincola]